MTALALSGAVVAQSLPRIVSLDGCADQYVLGLVPRAQLIALSDRAALDDSYFRDRVAGIPRVKPKLETILSLEPDIVVRTWGGDARLLQRLAHYGIKVITINDVHTYAEARDELYRIANALNQPASADIEAHNFDEAIAHIQPVGAGRTVLYYTPSGYTAGPDTMVGDMLRHLGFRLETQDKGYFYLSPEVLLSLNPDVFALAYYDDPFAMRRVPGRHPLVRAAITARPNIILPARAISCAGWFTAYDLENLSQLPLSAGTP